MELSREERNSLSGAATRLRAASRWLVAACEREAVPRAPEFEDWPFSRRSAAAARAAESDQAEDERLRAGVDAGLAAARELVSRAPFDPTARAATSFFASNASEYLRTSEALHTSRREPNLSVGVCAEELHMAAARLVRSVRDASDRDASDIEEALPPRPVPHAPGAACERLRQDLARFGERPDGRSGDDRAQLMFAREVEAALAIVANRADRVPAAVVLAAGRATVALDCWDRATGSFRACPGQLSRPRSAGDATPSPWRAQPDDVAEAKEIPLRGKRRGRRRQGPPLAARETEPPLHNVRRGAPRAASHP
jgi:hypothetical protein